MNLVEFSVIKNYLFLANKCSLQLWVVTTWLFNNNEFHLEFQAYSCHQSDVCLNTKVFGLLKLANSRLSYSTMSLSCHCDCISEWIFNVIQQFDAYSIKGTYELQNSIRKSISHHYTYPQCHFRVSWCRIWYDFLCMYIYFESEQMLKKVFLYFSFSTVAFSIKILPTNR